MLRIETLVFLFGLLSSTEVTKKVRISKKMANFVHAPTLSTEDNDYNDAQNLLCFDSLSKLSSVCSNCKSIRQSLRFVPSPICSLRLWSKLRLWAHACALCLRRATLPTSFVWSCSQTWLSLSRIPS